MEREIREGMIVRSSDGEKLGKVIRCRADEFIIEKGFFFPKDYVVRYDQARVNGDEVLLSMPASSLREAGDESGASREHTAAGLGTELGTYASGTSGRIVERRAEGEVDRDEVKIDREDDLTEGGDGSVKEPEE